MNSNSNQQFLSDFLITHLHSLLTRELLCGAFEADQHIAWFTKEWRYFSPQKDQHSFNQFARDEVIAHVGKNRLKKVEPPKEIPRMTHLRGPHANFGMTQATASVTDVAGDTQAAWRRRMHSGGRTTNLSLVRRHRSVATRPASPASSSRGYCGADVAPRCPDHSLVPRPRQRDTTRQWLKNAVNWTVADYFRDSTRSKRDSRREVSYEALEAS